MKTGKRREVYGHAAGFKGNSFRPPPIKVILEKEKEESMKIQGPGQTQSTSKSKKADKAKKADGSFKDMVAGGAQETAESGTAQSIAKVDALLAVQGAEDPTERATRGRMVRRADDILEELDKLRGAMLGGTMTVGHIIDIADVVASHREKTGDPALTAILDEIDLRAQVELAKMRKALE